MFQFHFTRAPSRLLKQSQDNLQHLTRTTHSLLFFLPAIYFTLLIDHLDSFPKVEWIARLLEQFSHFSGSEKSWWSEGRGAKKLRKRAETWSKPPRALQEEMGENYSSSSSSPKKAVKVWQRYLLLKSCPFGIVFQLTGPFFSRSRNSVRKVGMAETFLRCVMGVKWKELSHTPVINASIFDRYLK